VRNLFSRQLLASENCQPHVRNRRWIWARPCPTSARISTKDSTILKVHPLLLSISSCPEIQRIASERVILSLSHDTDICYIFHHRSSQEGNRPRGPRSIDDIERRITKSSKKSACIAVIRSRPKNFHRSFPLETGLGTMPQNRVLTLHSVSGPFLFCCHLRTWMSPCGICIWRNRAARYTMENMICIVKRIPLTDVYMLLPRDWA
jgi:hypothetical protein